MNLDEWANKKCWECGVELMGEDYTVRDYDEWHKPEYFCSQFCEDKYWDRVVVVEWDDSWPERVK